MPPITIKRVIDFDGDIKGDKIIEAVRTVAGNNLFIREKIEKNCSTSLVLGIISNFPDMDVLVRPEIPGAFSPDLKYRSIVLVNTNLEKKKDAVAVSADAIEDYMRSVENKIRKQLQM